MSDVRDAWLHGVLTGTDPGREAAIAAYRERHGHWLECGAWLDSHLDDPRMGERCMRHEQMTIELGQLLEATSQQTGLSRKELIRLAEEGRALEVGPAAPSTEPGPSTEQSG